MKLAIFTLLAPQVTNLAYAPAFLMKNKVILGKSGKMSDFLKKDQIPWNLVKFSDFYDISWILVKMTKIAEFSTFRPSRPAGRLGLASHEPTLVASDPMLGGPRRAQGFPDRDLGGHRLATSGPPVRSLGTRGTGEPSDE